MAKTLCDWAKRDIEASPDKLATIVSQPAFFCRKCARAACKKGFLCRPTKLAGK